MSRFIKNEDNTVTDTKLGLIWSATLMDGKDRPYEEGEAAVAALGPEWRLPTIEELLSLVDRTRHEPAIDTEFFPDTKNDWYWSSTPTSWNESASWFVGFHLGGSSLILRSDLACVRAVRSVPVSQ